MKTAVTSYSFTQYIKKGLTDQVSLISKAKQLGFDAVEFTDLTPPDGVSETEYAKRIREECERVGIPVSNYTVGADFYGKGGKEEAERIKKKIDTAVILGASGLRHDASWTTPASPYGYRYVTDTIAPAIREVSDYAAEKGIRTMVENHGYFIQDADRVEYLINAVGHPNFGWLCDMGNFLCADECPEKSCGKAAPYAFYVHAKDFIVKRGDGQDPGEGFFKSRGANYLRGTIVGHGSVPVKQCLAVLKRAGYDGYVSIEFEGMEDCETALRIGIANLKRYLSEI